MPELPEVEVVRGGLAPVVVGARIDEVLVSDDRALTRHPGSADDFTERTTGRIVSAAVRRGKFLWLPIGGGEAIIGHLGMSGQLLIGDRDGAPLRHERVRFSLTTAQGHRVGIFFVDQRTFGSLAVDSLHTTPDGAPGGWGSELPLVPQQALHIARDALDPAFDDALFAHRVRRSRSGIKRLLLDQTLVSGIGNIYADEALWAARIHPEAAGEALTPRAVDRLLVEVRAVLDRALAEGGTSFDTQYVNVNGQAGYFAHSLNAYGREGQPCPRCGTPVRRAPFANRSSHFCPRCQRRR